MREIGYEKVTGYVEHTCSALRSRTSSGRILSRRHAEGGAAPGGLRVGEEPQRREHRDRRRRGGGRHQGDHRLVAARPLGGTGRERRREVARLHGGVRRISDRGLVTRSVDASSLALASLLLVGAFANAGAAGVAPEGSIRTDGGAFAGSADCEAPADLNRLVGSLDASDV